MWIFGYGSLIWKVDFPIKRQVTGHIKGFHRRFWQGSTDHRGVPGNPGRVVTLIPATEKDCVYGVAYEIAEGDVENVRKHLDHREKGGYSKHRIVFYPCDAEVTPFHLEMYIGTEDNPNYLGPALMADIAETIYHSVGPSGRNVEYLLNLAKALKTVSPDVKDEHIAELEQLVNKMCNSNGNQQKSLI